MLPYRCWIAAITAWRARQSDTPAWLVKNDANATLSSSRTSKISLKNHSTPQGAGRALSPKPTAIQVPPPLPPPPPVLLTSCKIHVLDVSEDIATEAGLPQCDYTDTSSARNVSASSSSLGTSAYAMGYWLAKAIRNSDYYTPKIKEADLVFVDTHCYWTWYDSLRRKAAKSGAAFDPFNPASDALSRVFVEGVYKLKTFTRTAGRRYVFTRPQYFNPPGAMMDTCGKLKRSFLLVSERGIFCSNDRNRAAKGDSLIVPMVVTKASNSPAVPPGGSKRRTLLHYSGRCPPRKGSSPAQVLLAAMHKELGGWKWFWGDKDVGISCMETTDAQYQQDAADDEAMQVDAMQRAVFCAVPPGADSQATRILPAAILAGCIPVFLGPPWHSMPFAGDVNYAGMAMFFNVTGAGQLQREAEGQYADPDGQVPWVPLAAGELEPNAGIDTAVIEVPTFQAMVDYLRRLPEGKVRAMQLALQVEKPKFYYPPIPHEEGNASYSVLGQIVLQRMCEYAVRLNAVLAENEAKKAAGINPHGGFFMPKIAEGGLDAQNGMDNVDDVDKRKTGAIGAGKAKANDSGKPRQKRGRNKQKKQAGMRV